MPEPRSPQEIWDGISQVTAAFSLLECDKCAIAVLAWLNAQGCPGKVLRLRTKQRSDLYIISDRISSGGTRFAVKFQELKGVCDAWTF
jgi:Papain fold toxin 2